jgi:hypothetical protein
MVTIERPNTFSKLAWCPTRLSCLGALVKDSSIVRLFDVQQNEFDLMAVEDDLPPPVLERTIHCNTYQLKCTLTNLSIECFVDYGR